MRDRAPECSSTVPLGATDRHVVSCPVRASSCGTCSRRPTSRTPPLRRRTGVRTVVTRGSTVAGVSEIAQRYRCCTPTTDDACVARTPRARGRRRRCERRRRRCDVLADGFGSAPASQGRTPGRRSIRACRLLPAGRLHVVHWRHAGSTQARPHRRRPDLIEWPGLLIDLIPQVRPSGARASGRPPALQLDGRCAVSPAAGAGPPSARARAGAARRSSPGLVRLLEPWGSVRVAGESVPTPMWRKCEDEMWILSRLAPHRVRAGPGVRRSSPVSGRVTRKTEPSPGDALHGDLPPCARTSSLTMESPMPAPPVARERDFSPRQKRVNTCGRSSGGDADTAVGDLEHRVVADAAARQGSRGLRHRCTAGHW